MNKLYEVEIKILKIMFNDLNYSAEEIDMLLQKTTLIERDIDPMGFHTTIHVEGFDFNRYRDGWPWGGAIGKTKSSVDVLYGIFRSGNNLMIDGATCGDDLYPADETDYEVFYHKVPRIT